jgi:G3E family GTPase
MFLSEEADRSRLPVALVCGFLGSGKTTLINALLRDPRLADTAVAINEFGEEPLDQHLIDHGEDRTVVMANGCLCCNLAGDMEEAVMRVFSRRASGALPRFARLIVEPSGLADPAPIAQAILRNPAMSRVLRLDSIVATVDALFGERQLAEHPESRKQAGLADRVVLTKTDLAAAEAVTRLRAALARCNPAEPVLDVRHGAVDAAALFTAQFFDPGEGPASAAWLPAAENDRRLERHAHAAHRDDARAVSIVSAAPVNWRAFDDWLRRVRLRWADELLRLKGIVHVAGSARPVVLHGVHHVLHPPVELDAWPSDDRRSRLVFIVRGAAEEDIRASWQSAAPDMCEAA